MVITPECPKMVPNDVAREGLVVPIMLIGLQECVTSLIMDIVIYELDLTIAIFNICVEPARA